MLISCVCQSIRANLRRTEITMVPTRSCIDTVITQYDMAVSYLPLATWYWLKTHSIKNTGLALAPRHSLQERDPSLLCNYHCLAEL